MIFTVAFSCHFEQEDNTIRPNLSFEKINYFKYPKDQAEPPFKTRLTYYFENAKPFRWMELDSVGNVVTDYIYEYDQNWIQTSARYREESEEKYSKEKVSFKNDSTRITEWIDSTGSVYYTMIDNLNKENKTYRAAFIGDELHGYDSTFYTQEGFQKRIFFTNTKGKVFNDRQFIYDALNSKGDWTIRKKLMMDTIREIHERENYYNDNFISANGKFYEGIISTGEFSENVISFTDDESIMLLTRTSNWTDQSAYIAYKKNGLFTEAIAVEELDSIYNGAISPKGDKIIYSTRNEDEVNNWLIHKDDNGWTNRINLTEESNISGGYFHWFDEKEIYFYRPINNGDLCIGELNEGKLIVIDSLPALNTSTSTEFSPFVDKKKRFIIFSRYKEGVPANQGFFVSYNLAGFLNPKWSKPKKISKLPYGWSPFIINEGKQFIYTNGEDIFSLPYSELQLDIGPYSK